MKILKWLLIVVVALVALTLLAALLLPGSYRIEKSVEINRPVDSVFAQVADYHNFKQWNPWSVADPEATFTISGAPATPGHKYEWNGKKVGIGSLTIDQIVPNEAVKAKLAFVEPMVSSADDMFKFETTASGSTKVTWVNEGGLAFPIERLFGPFLTKALNQQFEEGLANLKKRCEK